MGGYVDGFVLAVKRKRLAEYEKLAKYAAKVWKRHGALEYRECVLEDTKIYFGPGFQKTAKCGKGEVAVFSWISYKSRKHRDRVNAKVMADPDLAQMCNPKDAPFDVRRMAYGGFKVLVAR